jgi:hypothetical protein
MRQRRACRRILVAFLCALAPAVLLGQANAGEVAVFGGGSFGLGAHPTIGGSTGVGFARHAMALFEVAYTPMGQDTLRRAPPMVSQQSSRMFDFNVSFHIKAQLGERWAPYAILGGGLLWNPYRYATPSQAWSDSSEVNFGFHTGGGVRYYLRPDFGFRPECRIIISTRTHARVTVGFFYHLPADWP